MVAQLCVQYLGDTAGADRRWSDLLKIAITPMAWGTDFHVYVTCYDKIDHLQFCMKFAFWVWIDAEFTVEFNGQRARL